MELIMHKVLSARFAAICKRVKPSSRQFARSKTNPVARSIAQLLLASVCLITGSTLAYSQSTGQSSGQSEDPVAPGNSALDDARPVIVLRTTEGDIVLELDKERAPATVENFLSYVNDDFYAGTLFHRVIDGFMIQGGGFTKDYQRKPTKTPVSNEAYNGLTNTRYTIAMARTTAPHSATSQFFINTADNRNLDHTATTQRGWGYTVFGKVIEGTDVVDAISQARTGPGGPFSRDAPQEPIVILGAELVQGTEKDGAAVLSPNGEPDKEPAGGVAAAIPDESDHN